MHAGECAVQSSSNYSKYRRWELEVPKSKWSVATQTKMIGQGSLELALIMKKKERLTKYLVLACTIVLMNDLGLNR